MSKKNIETSKQSYPVLPSYTSYSIKEILAAGGTTAFADKMGKTPQALVDSLSKLPKDAFLTEEEFEQAIKTLDESK